MKRVVDLLAHPLLVPVWVVVVAALVLLPRLGTPGLWEPQELAVADAAMARADAVAKGEPRSDQGQDLGPLMTALAAGKLDEVRALGDAARCPRQAPDDHGPRTLTDRLAARGASSVESADATMRLGLAGLAILCVLATAGIAGRLGGARAAGIAALACLSFPLLILQARQLTSDIGTATGGALLVYGCVALPRPVRGRLAIPDVLLSILAVVAGAWLGWSGGGSLLGLVVPILAVAIAGGLGLGLVPIGARLAGQGAVRAGGTVQPRLGIGRRRPWAEITGQGSDLLVPLVALIASAISAWLLVRLAVQVYDALPPIPGMRQIGGYTIKPAGCWSNDLGGLWKLDDDLRATYDSVFEQIAFGVFPFGILAPIAMGALALAPGGRERYAGALTVAWAGAAWIATQVWQRKVGFAVWPGFPAAAVAIGVWLDGVLAARVRADGGERHDPTSPTPPWSLLVAVFVFLGAVAVGKDVVAFPEKMVSLLVEGDAIKYPKLDVRWLWVPLKSWVVALGSAFGLVAAVGIALWKPRRDHAPPWEIAGRRGVAVALVMSVLLALFWVHVWHGSLSRNLSSKRIFTSYRELRQPGDALGIMGDMANSPRYYAGGPWERINGRDGLSSFLGRDARVFALVPAGELCPIHRQFAGKPYFVLDDSNVRTLLLSNKLDGAVDKNPLARAIQRSEPKDVKARPTGRIVWDDKIELVGWTLPERAKRGGSFKVTLFFKILGNVSGSWKIFAHFDGGGLRFQGDHDPIGGRCATSYWQPGDYVVDTFSVDAGDMTFQKRDYELRVGFFTGSSPNWKNMPISEAPSGLKDKAERFLVGRIRVD